MTAPTPDIFRQGALIVPDVITPAEERRILERIASAPWLRDLNRRVQHYGFRYDYRSPGAREPASPFPPWAEHHGPAVAGILRGRAADPVHRERIPARAGHRHAHRVTAISAPPSRRCRLRTTGRCGSVPAAPARTSATARRTTACSRCRAARCWCCASGPGPSGCTASIPRTPPAGAPRGSRPRSARLRADERAPERRREVESGR